MTFSGKIRQLDVQAERALCQVILNSLEGQELVATTGDALTLSVLGLSISLARYVTLEYSPASSNRITRVILAAS
jgi:hypothetical protein